MATAHEDPRFTEASEKFVATAKEILQMLHPKLPSGVLAQQQTYRRVFEDNYSSLVPVEVPGWPPSLVGSEFDVLVVSPAVQDCIQFHIRCGIFDVPEMSSADGRQIRDPEYPKYAPHLLTRLQYPVLRAIEDTGRLDAITNDVLIAAYREYYDAWTGSSYRGEVYVPLIGASIDTEAKITDSISIRNLSDDFKSDLYNTFGDHGWLNLHEFYASKAMVVIDQSGTKGESSPRRDDKFTRSEIIHLVSAIRIEGGVRCGANCYYTRYFGPREMIGNTRISGGLEEVAIHSAARYRETTEIANTPQIAARFEKLRSIDDSSFTLALRRFNLSCGRLNAEDEVIDLAIVLECLLLEGSGELTFRLKAFASQLLKHSSAPEDVCRWVDSLYTVRSTIVHEGARLSGVFDASPKTLRRIGCNNAGEALALFRKTAKTILSTVSDELQTSSLKEVRERLRLATIGVEKRNDATEESDDGDA